MGEDKRKIHELIQKRRWRIKGCCAKSVICAAALLSYSALRGTEFRFRRRNFFTKRKESHFCDSKGEKVYEKVFFIKNNYSI